MTGATTAMIVAVGLVTLMVFLSALHMYWGLGGVWPGHDGPSAVSYIIGHTRTGRMPGPFLAGQVAIALLVVALLIAWRAAILPTFGVPTVLLAIAFWGAVSVFLARGIAGYTSIFDYASDTPFYNLNRWFYSPLCLAIAAAMAGVWAAAPARD